MMRFSERFTEEIPDEGGFIGLLFVDFALKLQYINCLGISLVYLLILLTFCNIKCKEWINDPSA